MLHKTDLFVKKVKDLRATFYKVLIVTGHGIIQGDHKLAYPLRPKIPDEQFKIEDVFN